MCESRSLHDVLRRESFHSTSFSITDFYFILTTTSCSQYHQPFAGEGRDVSSHLPAYPGQAWTRTQDSQNPSCPYALSLALLGPPPPSVLTLPPPWKGTCWNLSPGQGPAVTLPAAGTLVCGIWCQLAGPARNTHTASDTTEVGRRSSALGRGCS